MARPTIYSDKLAAKIADKIREGSAQDDAARLAGINPDTFYTWLKRNSEFSDLIQKAHSDFKEKQIEAIRLAGVRQGIGGKVAGSWQANAWLLERKYPDEFAQRITVKVTDKDAELLKRHGLTPAQAWSALVEQLAQAETGTDVEQ